MKKFVLYILFCLSIVLTSCSTPVRGSYEWSKKYGNSGIARNRSSECGLKNMKKVKRPKGTKVKYSKAKKVKSKGKKNNKKKR